MRAQNFYYRLVDELFSARRRLIPLFEKRDRLLYYEAPKLRNEYIEKIGRFEESVLDEELKLALLKEKLRLIQSALNRREKPDEERIDELIEKKRAELLESAMKLDCTLSAVKELSEAEEHTLGRIYREIIDGYSPALNSELTKTQKELYEKAEEAYRNRDLDELKLINEMLSGDMAEDDTKVIQNDPAENSPAQERIQYYKMAAEYLSTDYTLAGTLYSCFEVTEEDRTALDLISRYDAKREQLESEIAGIKASFPFSAEEVLRDPEKTAEYIEELRVRKKNCVNEIKETEDRIVGLTGDI